MQHIEYVFSSRSQRKTQQVGEPQNILGPLFYIKLRQDKGPYAILPSLGSFRCGGGRNDYLGDVGLLEKTKGDRRGDVPSADRHDLVFNGGADRDFLPICLVVDSALLLGST